MHVCVAGNPSLTRAIPERPSGELHGIRRYTKCVVCLLLTQGLYSTRVVASISGNAVRHVSEVTVRRVRLVLR